MILTKQTMKQMIENDDTWLNGAIIRMSQIALDNTYNLNLSEHEIYNLTYWSGWVKTKKNLTNPHRSEAIQFVNSKCEECLWEYIVRNNTKGTTK